MNGYGNFVDGASAGFQDTILPASLDAIFFPIAQIFLAVVPFVEVLLGLFLLVGLYRIYALFITGILFVLLIMGMLLIGDVSSANFLFIYLIAVAGALSLPGYCCAYMCCVYAMPEKKKLMLKKKTLPVRKTTGRKKK
jgi:hypothetical protein